jgi:hypothetical protein
MSLLIKKRSPLIGCFFIEAIAFLNLSVILYLFLKNNIFSFYIDGTIIALVIILMTLVLWFLLIPHYKTYKTSFIKNQKSEINSEDVTSIISNSTKNVILSFNVISLGAIYYLINIAKVLPFQSISEYPTNSLIVIIMGFIILAFLIFNGNRIMRK